MVHRSVLGCFFSTYLYMYIYALHHVFFFVSCLRLQNCDLRFAHGLYVHLLWSSMYPKRGPHILHALFAHGVFHPCSTMKLRLFKGSSSGYGSHHNIYGLDFLGECTSQGSLTTPDTSTDRDRP